MKIQLFWAPETRHDGWVATTDKNEEALVILEVRCEALIDGDAKLPFVVPALVHISPATRRIVANTKKKLLEYLHMIAPAK